MGRDMYHSAEGTHWTKKNHKYIRKEGNRYIYPSDANKLRGSKAINNQSSPDYKALSQQKANRSAAASGKVVNPSFALRDSDGRKVATIHTKESFPTATTRDFKRYSGEMAQRGKVSRQSSPDYRSVSQNHAGAMAKERNDRKTMNELKRSNATYQQNTPNYSSRSKQHAAVTNQASPDYRSVSQNQANYNKQRSAVSSQASPNYRATSSRRAALNNQGSTNYRQLGQQKANRTAAANGAADHIRLDDGTYLKEYGSHQQQAKRGLKNRQIMSNRSNALNSQVSPDYRSVSQNHANTMNRSAAVSNQASPDYKSVSKRKAAIKRQSTPDYRSVSQNHADSMNRSSAVNSQGSFDYRSAGSNSERTNKTKKQLQAKNRQRALYRQDGGGYEGQLHSKTESSKWRRDHAQNPDGSYGARDGEAWEWDNTRHTHSSAGAKRQGLLNKAKSGSQSKRDRGSEIVKEVRDNYSTVNKVKAKGKKAIDSLRKRFKKK